MYYIYTCNSERLLHIIAKDMYYIDTSKSVELLHIIAKDMYYIDTSKSVELLHIICVIILQSYYCLYSTCLQL
jgi:hypothetical protein